MFVGSRFCPHCGIESAREVLDESPIPCPGCTGEMQAIRLGTTLLRECSACGGLWLAGRAFEQVCAEREGRTRVLTLLRASPAEAVRPALAKVRYLPCPGCKKVMNRSNFARSSGIVVDVCKAHGVWLDSGELQRIIAFIDSGGLERARALEQERLAHEQSRLRDQQRRLDATKVHHYRMQTSHERLTPGDNAAVIIDFIRAVIDS